MGSSSVIARTWLRRSVTALLRIARSLGSGFEEFKRALAKAQEAGASSAGEIAVVLNQSGHRTARGGTWAEAENVHRMLKKIEADAPGGNRPAPSSPKPRKEPISSPSRYLHTSGFDRIQRIMDLRKLKMGDVMRELGLKPLNASVGNAKGGSTRVRAETLVKL